MSPPQNGITHGVPSNMPVVEAMHTTSPEITPAVLQVPLPAEHVTTPPPSNGVFYSGPAAPSDLDIASGTNTWLSSTGLTSSAVWSPNNVYKGKRQYANIYGPSFKPSIPFDF